MKIERPAVASLSADQLPFPVIQMETELGHREADYPRYAKYSIRVGNLGTISVDEALAADGACVNLPPDFVWHDDNGSKRSTARFCLPGADGRRNVLVQASAQADTGTLASVKSALVGIAACRMTLYPSQYDSRDVFSNGERLLVGPYWLGR